MLRTKLNSLSLIVWVVLSTHSAQATDRLCWGTLDSQSGSIFCSDLDGANVDRVIDGIHHLFQVLVDGTEGKIYWQNSYEIGRVNLDGTQPESIFDVSGEAGWIHEIALDPVGRKIYWSFQSGHSSDAIQRANLDGTQIEDVLRQDGPFSPSALALDSARATLYYVDEFKHIRSLDLNTLRIETIFSIPEFRVEYMLMDHIRDKLYWSATMSRFYRSNLDGTNVEILRDDTTIISGLVLDEPRGHLYWVRALSGTIQRIDLDGDNFQFIIGGLPTPSGVTLQLDCGNGAVDIGETCDIAIPDGTSGACLTTCDDLDGCTVDEGMLGGGSCQAECQFTTITETVDGDGCCPTGFAGVSDSDCAGGTIPTASAWGLIVLALTLLAASRIYFEVNPGFERE